MPAEASPRMSREGVERIYPLRPLQQGMLFHELMSQGASPYFRQASFTLKGVFDPALCEATWNRLMARHPLLRSVFDHQRTAQPLQIVLKRQTVAFGFQDVSGPGAEARIEAWRREDRRRGFDLTHDPLMRVQVFRRGADLWEMVWSHPHILLDGWSGAILLEEFGQLYAAAASATLADGDLPPPPDPEPYLTALTARDDAAAARHWGALLAGYEALASLPRLDASGGAAQPGEHRFQLGELETTALAALAARHGATLGVMLQALWGLVLGRWTDRRDVVFGVVVSGRSVATPGVDRLVGMFINTIPVRVRWGEGEDIGDLLRALGRQALEGLDHDHAALSDIQAASALPNGLLDHLLVLENYPAPAADRADVGFTVTGSAAAEHSHYDFGLLVHAGAVLDIAIPYDAAVLPPEQMTAVEHHLRTLIAALLAAPGVLLRDLDPLPAEERRALAALAQGPTTPWPQAATLADLWAAQVDRTPEAVAVVSGVERLSYRALDQAAEGVAHRLRADGTAPGQVVGVMAERSPQRIIALLGILKLGGVYLPLSPRLPDERLAFMLEDSGCGRVLADEAQLERLAALGDDLARPIAGAFAAGRGRCGAAATDIAYLIYTSGSTGRPKGVTVEHRGFINMILAQIEGFGLRAEDGVLQFASCSFDASLSEIFMALLVGARLVIAPQGAIAEGETFLALLRAEAVTVATLPPSYLRALEGADLGPLRVLITAGEPPDPDDARRYGARLRYFNAYGPTEASVCASWHEVVAGAVAGPIPIGRPIANMRMAVRDRTGRLTPRGAVGEICLSGPGLARGYLGQPALTADRFVILDGERWYRTGDAGVLGRDGEVIYLGRQDTQVKLNGYRIELGEIESALRDQPNVAQAVALVVEGRITAFVTPAGPLDAAALRDRLAAVLPPWMTPSVVTPLAALPLTLAGKIDRRALAAIKAKPAPALEAMTPRETLVAEAFAAVLGEGAFGRNSSFASAGGDSLRAIRLLGRLRRGGLTIALRDMLAADTVAGIAQRGGAGGVDRRAPASGPIPLTPIQRWFFDAHHGDLARFNHLVLLQAPGGAFDEGPLAAALERLWRRHDALRSSFRRTSEGWAQHAGASDASFRLRRVDLRDEADPWPRLTADADALQSTFDLAGGDLFKATLYRLARGDQLLLNAHHLVVDAISWHVLIEDLAQDLQRPGLDPGGSSPYQDWALALEAWSRAGAEVDRPYWTAVARAEAPRLPTDFPVVSHGYDETALLELDLGPMPTQRTDRSVVARTLAALGCALWSWDGRQAARIMLSSHGRHPPMPGVDCSRTVGWFTADFPFLLDCHAAPDAILAQLEDTPSKGLGWGALRWLSPDPVRAPEPEISLNHLGDLGRPSHSGFAISRRLPDVAIGKLTRPRLIEIETSLDAGRLRLNLRYAPRIHRAATLRDLAEKIADNFS